ncbi:MAG: hypothetical protein M1834_000100 [Cirrosporium novae-zelandiae]|nr:MAG: hypothetical protein M1834_000100 [Cirrosporium novae-zelandiae]
MSSSEAQPNEMQINLQRAGHLLENLAETAARIKAVSPAGKTVRLIAVSKLKPASDILSLHQPPTLSYPPHSHFGENYLPEILHKSSILPRSIHWHFIGALQSNKCQPLAKSIPNLWAVESLDSIKKANLLEKGRTALVEELEKNGNQEEKKSLIESGEGEGGKKLRVFVQVNTSGEESKSGVEPNETTAICNHIITSCPHLHLQGLMTIGAIARSQATSPEHMNEDFMCLKEVKDKVTKELGEKLAGRELELSMGMSGDFEGAVAMGSDEVRVGSSIFGERMGKAEAKEKKEKGEMH